MRFFSQSRIDPFDLAPQPLEFELCDMSLFFAQTKLCDQGLIGEESEFWPEQT